MWEFDLFFIFDGSRLNVGGLGSDNHQWDSTQRWSCKVKSWRPAFSVSAELKSFFPNPHTPIFERLHILLKCLKKAKEPDCFGSSHVVCRPPAAAIRQEVWLSRAATQCFLVVSGFLFTVSELFLKARNHKVSKITAVFFYYIGEPPSTGIHCNWAWKLKAVTKAESRFHLSSQDGLKGSWWSNGWSGSVRQQSPCAHTCLCEMWDSKRNTKDCGLWHIHLSVGEVLFWEKWISEGGTSCLHVFSHDGSWVNRQWSQEAHSLKDTTDAWNIKGLSADFITSFFFGEDPLLSLPSLTRLDT